jgi:hypothetical protein
MPRLFRLASAAAAALVVATALTIAANAQTMGTPAKYVATAVDMNRGAAGTIEIAVDRWSSDKDRDRLMTVLMEKGPEKLLDVLQDMPRMGYFRAPGNLGWDIHFARMIPLPDGGERVVLVTDRRIGFWEASRQPRSIDYPFTVIELRLNRDGEGEGKLSIATKIIPDRENNIVTLENYAIQPVQLTTVRREKRTE